MASIEKTIATRIQAMPHGACFTSATFLDLGSPEAVRIALHRLEKRRLIRRLARGLYDFPKQHPVIGILSPQPTQVAKALSERDAARLQPSGAYAANILGLSDQIPARIVFLTDGPARHIRVGSQEIILQNTTPRNMATAGRASGTVIQALRHMGGKEITQHHIAHLRATLSAEERAQLKHDRIYAPGWMHRILDTIAEETHD